jgi:hypothetical protein
MADRIAGGFRGRQCGPGTGLAVGPGPAGPGGVTPPTLGCPTEVDWRGVDATDPAAATEAAKGGAAVIYQCLNAPYSKWADCFPPLQRGVLAAAERNGALLVSLENLYGYGPTGGAPMTEDLPLVATTVKGPHPGGHDPGAARRPGRRAGPYRHRSGVGLLRCRRHRIHARRARLRQRLAGRRADFIGNPELLHTYSYVPDIAPAWPPWAPTSGHRRRLAPTRTRNVTTRQVLDLIGDEVGHPVESRSVSKLTLRALGLVNPGTAVHGRDDLPVRPALRARHQPSTKRLSGRPAPHSARPSPPPSPGIESARSAHKDRDRRLGPLRTDRTKGTRHEPQSPPTEGTKGISR